MKILRDSAKTEKYQLGVFGLGYESRAIALHCDRGDLCDHKIAVGYERFTDKLSYKRNRRHYEEQGASIDEFDDTKRGVDSGLIEFIRKAMEESGSLDGPVNVLLDISVMTRTRLSEVLWLLISELQPGSKVTVGYSVAQYTSPPKVNYPVRVFGPIFDDIVTLSPRIGDPLILLVGLGYEPGKALGAVNAIDPPEVVFYIPKNADTNFERDVRNNNRNLLEDYRSSPIVEYYVSSPFSAYYDMKSLVSSEINSKRISILPLGPKILSAISVILAKEFHPELTIWRVSSLDDEEPVEKLASGQLVEFTIEC